MYLDITIPSINTPVLILGVFIVGFGFGIQFSRRRGR